MVRRSFTFWKTCARVQFYRATTEGVWTPYTVSPPFTMVSRGAEIEPWFVTLPGAAIIMVQNLVETGREEGRDYRF